MNIQNFVLIDAPRTTIAGHTIIAPFHAQVYRVTIRNCCLIRYKDGELRAWSPSAFGRGEPAAVFKNPFRRKLFDEAGECFVPPHGTRRPNRMASFQTTKTDPPREPVVDAPSFLATVARHGRRPLRGRADWASIHILGKPFAEATAADLLPLPRDELPDDLA